MQTELIDFIKQTAHNLGFQDIAVTNTELGNIPNRYQAMISRGFHADMEYLNKNMDLRNNPDNLVQNTRSIIMVRMDYLPADPKIISTLRDKTKAYIARYALGRDYHRIIRKRLKQLAKHIERKYGSFDWRPFADSAPVHEKPLAEKAGLGWQGKNTLIINRKAGSYFFLGALYTSLDLPSNKPADNHCGSCQACIDICPTQAIVAPYQLDSRRCISFWTIEHKGVIPQDIATKMGNRVFGCDDCQLICPWNKFAKSAQEQAFIPRYQLDSSKLIDLFSWDEQTYLDKTEGSAIRRTGYEGWQRNLAIGLGNGPASKQALTALKEKLSTDNPVVQMQSYHAYNLLRHKYHTLEPV